jgi:hypothetical protein
MTTRPPEKLDAQKTANARNRLACSFRCIATITTISSQFSEQTVHGAAPSSTNL